jgi:chemotaxis protein histidine kinase CheA/CheY-like chemotaxis protein
VLIRRLTEQADDLVALATTAREIALQMSDEGEVLARLSLQLWDSLQAIRIAPVRGLFQRLVRVAREAARVEGRTVEVGLVGEDTGADRPLLDRLFEPLLHVVRNAVGHGIEAPDDRRAAGKPAAGRITLEARREGNVLVVSVQDDGRGLDDAAIAAKARSLGLLGDDDPADPERLHALIFHPGFSTRRHSNAISGRGVGMDVVAREVAQLRGRVELHSRRGEGTRLIVRVPAWLSLEHVMIVRVSGQALAVPIRSIESIHLYDEAEVSTDGESSRTVVLGGQRYPLIDARSALGFSGAARRACPTLLVVTAEDRRVALLVDAVDGPRELVLKPLGALLAGHPAISGAGLTSTGAIVFALDLAGLARLDRGGGPRATFEAERAATEPPALVVDDSLSVRRVATRHLRALGFDVDEATDGEQALARLRDRTYRLILTDLEMPRMDGFELLEELRRSGTLKATSVVMSSTRTDPATRRRALDLGAVAFLPKPITTDDLARIVAALPAGSNEPTPVAVTS